MTVIPFSGTLNQNSTIPKNQQGLSFINSVLIIISIFYNGLSPQVISKKCPTPNISVVPVAVMHIGDVPPTYTEEAAFVALSLPFYTPTHS